MISSTHWFSPTMENPLSVEQGLLKRVFKGALAIQVILMSISQSSQISTLRSPSAGHSAPSSVATKSMVDLDSTHSQMLASTVTQYPAGLERLLQTLQSLVPSPISLVSSQSISRKSGISTPFMLAWASSRVRHWDALAFSSSPWWASKQYSILTSQSFVLL